VFAGTPLAGLPVRGFADLYPELTAGLVLVVIPTSGCAGRRRMRAGSSRYRKGTFGWLGWFGVPRALNLARGLSAGLPAHQAELRAGAELPALPLPWPLRSGPGR
jgi:hypothetical protein